RRLLRSALRGFEVVEADSVEAASDQLGSGPVDLVLLDLMMPGRDGFDLLRGLDMNEGTTPPVIIVSALSREAAKMESFRLGAEDFVVKPFSPRELAARVTTLLRR